MKRTFTIVLLGLFIVPFCAHEPKPPKVMQAVQANDTAYQHAKRRINQRLLSLESRIYSRPIKGEKVQELSASAPAYGPPE